MTKPSSAASAPNSTKHSKSTPTPQNHLKKTHKTKINHPTKNKKNDKKSAVVPVPVKSQVVAPFVNVHRTMMLAKSGITAPHRHLMKDLLTLMPHSKKEAKYDRTYDYTQINQLCALRKCSNCLFFESYNAGKELYLYAAKSPVGPTMKFRVSNISTMQELRMTGNCLRGSRPVLHFDAAFDTEPRLQLIKELFTQVFATPRHHPKSKPFVDHVFGFYVLDNKIWFRNYQIVDRALENEKMQLVEIGPRFVLDPVRVLDGCFEGDVLYNNDQFASIRQQKRVQGDQEKKRLLKKQKDLENHRDLVNSGKLDPVQMVWHENRNNNSKQEVDEDEEDQEDEVEVEESDDSDSDIMEEDEEHYSDDEEDEEDEE